MDLGALAACLATSACVVTQTTSGLIVGMLLFLVAAGVTLIFGVLKIVNFAHGTFYMLGGYVAYSTLGATDSYTLAVLSGTLAMALFGVLFERFLISRVYGSNVLMQLLVCYAVVLIFDDVVKIVWGPEFHAMGMPPAFQVPPLFLAGGVVPPFYAMLIAVVFAIGGGLAGLAGALAAPVRSLSPGMGFSILIESFIVTVIGGMGSIAGALVSALLIGMVRGFGTIGFPKFTDGLIYIVMIAILLLRPQGLFGRRS